MLRSDLEEYRDIVARLRTIETAEVSDTVKGSSDEFPFVTHSVLIHGVKSDSAAKREYDRLLEKKKAIDRFIDTMPDIRARNLLDLHYRKGYSWAAIASRTDRSIGANEIYLQRIFKCV